MKVLTEQILHQQQNIARFKKLEAMLADAENYKDILTRKCDDLKAELEKENADLLKLEGKSLSGLLYSLLGTLDKHMEKEKAEALAAKLKYDQAQKDLQEINERIEKLTNERDMYADSQRQYDELFAAKRQSLLEQNNMDADSILDLEKKIGAIKIHLKEICEAKDAGKKALEVLPVALDKLESAKSISTYDLIGGGMLASALKHDRIDEAAELLADAQRTLDLFYQEMSDVSLSIDISKMLCITDIFFDNIFTDYKVHKKINETLESVTKALNNVKTALDETEKIEKKKKEELEVLSESLKRLITYG